MMSRSTKVASLPTTASTRVLAIVDFRRYFYGLWFSTSGFWMLRVAMGWSAWESTHSAFWTGVVAALSMAPGAVLAPLFGVVADRIRLQQGIPRVALAFLGIALSLGLLSFFDRIEIGVLCVLATAYGLVGAAWQPMRLMMPVRLVPMALLPDVVGLTAMTFHTSRILGPLVAALLIDNFGVSAAYFTVALAYGVFLSLFLRVKLLPRNTKIEPPAGFFTRFLEGLAASRRTSGLSLAIGATLGCGLVARALLEMLPAIAGGLLASGAGGLAWLTASAGAGAVLAGWVLTRLPRQTAMVRQRILSGGLVACSLCSVVGFMPSLWSSAVLCLLIGLCTTLAGISSQTLLQLSVEERYRGRVMSLWTMAGFGGTAMGAMLMGILGDQMGLPQAFLACGIIGAVIFGYWLCLERQTDRDAVISRQSDT